MVRDLKTWKDKRITSKNYIVACGSILTPQLLYASKLSDYLPALGRYLTEQPFAFCQVVLRQNVVDNIESYLEDETLIKNVREYKENYGDIDPLPIPIKDPEPQLGRFVKAGQPWHCQIHRDAFSYGDIAPNVDSRLIVDLRWFGIIRPRIENRIKFEDKLLDTFGMPQPTFEVTLSESERLDATNMMADMLNIAKKLGGFLPNSHPQFLPLGLALHMGGVTRMGTNKTNSVVDEYSKVHGAANLYLGGNGLHPFGNAGNPTLTSIMTALYACEKILNKKY